MKILLLVLAAIGGGRVFAQTSETAHIDSLIKVLPGLKDDSNKAYVLYDLSYSHFSINADEGIKWGQECIALSRKLGWEKGLAFANRALAENYVTLGNYPAALEYSFKSQKIHEKGNDKRGIIAIMSTMAKAYMAQGEYAKALECNKRGLSLSEELGNKLQTSIAASNIAVAYINISDFTNALHYALKALKVSEEIADTIGIADAMLIIGNLYDQQDDYEKALEYFRKSLAAFTAMGVKQAMAEVMSNMAAIYSYQNNNTAALEYHFKSMALNKEEGNMQGMLRNSVSIGMSYMSMHNYTVALAYASAGLKKAEEMGARSLIANALGTLGATYLSLVQDSVEKPLLVRHELPAGFIPDKNIPTSKEERLRLAISYLERAHDSAKAVGVMDVWKESSQRLADAYQLQGMPVKALNAYKDYINVRDSIFGQKSKTKTLQQLMKYDFGRREDSIKLANALSEKAAALRLQRQRNYTWTGLVGIVLLVGFSFFIAKERNKSEKERKKSDGLLLNILPSEVAEELKVNGTTTAKHYDNVTLLFTDFVNFTQAGEQMTPQGLIDELHVCFKAFDEITTRYNIEKIKTIGDAYLAVCGLPSPDKKHAENTVRAAKEINDFMSDRLAKMGSNRTFQIRLGIHSGSVVAGIVGVKKFAYDIWGDTVNTAARMEQHGKAGRINISQTTYDLVKDKFSCEYRGEIEAKGKGGDEDVFCKLKKRKLCV